MSPFFSSKQGLMKHFEPIHWLQKTRSVALAASWITDPELCVHKGNMKAEMGRGLDQTVFGRLKSDFLDLKPIQLATNPISIGRTWHSHMLCHARNTHPTRGSM